MIESKLKATNCNRGQHRIFRLLKIHKKSRFTQIEIFFTDVHCVKYRIRRENKNFDVAGT